MKRKFGNVLIVLFLFSLVVTGCNLFGKDDVTSSTGTNTDTGGTSGGGTTTQRAEVDQILESDDFYKAEVSDMFNETEDYLDSSLTIGPNLSPSLIDTTLPKAVHPAGWIRQRTGLSGITKDYQFDTLGDTTTCLVTITRNITGILYVDTSFNFRRDAGQKPFADTISHKFYLEKWPTGWKLVKISPKEMKLTDTSKQKVYIDKVEIEKSGQIVFSVTSPTQMFLREELPHFNAWDKVTVMATVRNISPSYNPECFVFLHHFNVWGQVGRIPLFDDGPNGMHGDAVANDNIFTNTFYMHGPLIQHAAIDVLDSKCLQNQTEDDYNSNAWGLPYRVIH